MTEEEILKLEIRKELNRREIDRLRESTIEFEYLLESEQDIVLKDLYYEHLLTQAEIDDLESHDSEYSKKLLEELNKYREALTNLSSDKECNITKRLEMFED